MSTDYNQIQLVAFQLADEEYAVPVQNVESIIRRTRPTRVPGAPSHCLGVINLRGKVISIFDLRRRFGFGASVAEDDGRILVIHHNGMNTGVLVDGVSEVLSLDGSALRASPVGGGSHSMVSGLCKVEERLLIILDLTVVLSHDGVIAPPVITEDMAELAVEAQSAAVVAAEEIAAEALEPAAAEAEASPSTVG
ncbi:MAG: chemotaxis protein CheW [Actinomycetota bacterium]